MSEPQFFQTRMGQRFCERTLPELVRAVEQLNEILERIADVAERSQAHDMEGEPPKPPSPGRAAKG